MPHSLEDDAATAAVGARGGSRSRRRGRGCGGGSGGGVGGGSCSGRGTKVSADSSGMPKSMRVHHATRQGKMDRYAFAVAKGQRLSHATNSQTKGKGKVKSRGRKGLDAVRPIDFGYSDDEQAAGSAAVAEHDGWPAGTHERFTSFSP